MCLFIRIPKKNCNLFLFHLFYENHFGGKSSKTISDIYPKEISFTIWVQLLDNFKGTNAGIEKKRKIIILAEKKNTQMHAKQLNKHITDVYYSMHVIMDMCIAGMIIYLKQYIFMQLDFRILLYILVVLVYHKTGSLKEIICFKDRMLYMLKVEGCIIAQMDFALILINLYTR
ncbi:hypothetical protein ACJX0J_035589, partial [Zea mays]